MFFAARSDTQGCGTSLQTQSLAHLLTSHSLIQKPKKLKCPPKTAMTLLVSLASYIVFFSVLTFAHFSCFTHIYNNNTSTLYHHSFTHLTWVTRPTSKLEKEPTIIII